MNIIHSLYNKLLSTHGDPAFLWPQWCALDKDERTRQVIAIGAILTQRQSWTNVEIALQNLKDADVLNLEKISKLGSLNKLRELIRSAGFHNTKPKRLKALADFVMSEFGSISSMCRGDKNDLRAQLLNVYGIGPETADTILLYACDKPSFVVDEYLKRFCNKYELTTETKYDELKELFESSLERDVTIYQNYHVLIIADQKGNENCTMSII